MTVALVGVIVPNRTVLHASVVPECDRIGPPLEAHTEFRRLDVPIEHVEDCSALVLLETNNSCREEAVDEETLLPRDRVRPEYGVLGARVDLAAIVGHIPSTIDMLALMDCRHAIEHRLDRLGQRL